MGNFGTSEGQRLSTSAIESRIKKAKAELTLDCDHCCEHCNTNQGFLSWSHIVSVKYAKENGMSELCWNKNNMELLCMDCHHKVENRSNLERLEIYKNRTS